MFVIGGAGLHKVRTTINLMSLFSPDAEIIHSYRWLEDKLGPLVPMEVVVRLDEKEAKLTTVERFGSSSACRTRSSRSPTLAAPCRPPHSPLKSRPSAA